MIIYFLVWLILFILTLFFPTYFRPSLRLLLILFFTLFIGLRSDVGADWLRYLEIIDMAKGIPLQDAIFPDYSDFLSATTIPIEPFYSIPNWAGANTGLSVYLPNLIIAFIFSLGLILFCSNLKYPSTALLIAYPYLIVVVSLGYSRQSAAIGFEFLCILCIHSSRPLKSYLYAAAAGLSHTSGAIILLIPALTFVRNLSIRLRILFLSVSVTIISLGYVIAYEAYSTYLRVYVENTVSSQGAFIRLLILFFFAILYKLLARYSFLAPRIHTMYDIMANASIILMICFFFFPSSTALDRISLFLYPLPLYVAGTFSSILPQERHRLFVTVSLSALSLFQLFVWMNFSSYAHFWLPYKNIFF